MRRSLRQQLVRTKIITLFFFFFFFHFFFFFFRTAMLVIPPNEFVQLLAPHVDLNACAVGNTSSTLSASRNANVAFATDTDISANVSSGGVERQLVAWQPDSNGSDADLSLDGPAMDGAWDQFSENERKFGVKSTWDEEFYTTSIDKSASDYNERRLQAERIASQIESEARSKKTTNVHLREERGIEPIDDIDEEDRYGAVVRDAAATDPAPSDDAAAAKAAKLQQIGNAPAKRDKDKGKVAGPVVRDARTVNALNLDPPAKPGRGSQRNSGSATTAAAAVTASNSSSTVDQQSDATATTTTTTTITTTATTTVTSTVTATAAATTTTAPAAATATQAPNATPSTPTPATAASTASPAASTSALRPLRPLSAAVGAKEFKPLPMSAAAAVSFTPVAQKVPVQPSPPPTAYPTSPIQQRPGSPHSPQQQQQQQQQQQHSSSSSSNNNNNSRRRACASSSNGR
jgi:hypothetical protein